MTSQYFAYLVRDNLRIETLADARGFSVKRLSGDLDRLFRMGLLSRKRIKRVVLTRERLPILRGFQYQYKVSRQGLQYLKYLDKPKTSERNPSSDDPENRMKKDMIDLLYTRFPEHVADEYVIAFKDKKFEDRGRHNRFPAAKYRELGSFIDDIMQKLARKNREIIALQQHLSRFYGWTPIRPIYVPPIMF